MRTKNKEKSRLARVRLRQEALAIYGDGTCACCDENNQPLLTFDHILSDGKKDRAIGGTYHMLSRRKREGWPPGLRVLCYNCNIGRYRNGGICPHEDEAYLDLEEPNV